MKPGLVCGFGPFLDIADNPAAALARAVDGGFAGARPVVGRVMPVSYDRAPQITAQWVDALDPAWVLGIGVARSRSVAMVEAQAVLGFGATPDVDQCANPGWTGPDCVGSTLPATALAEALGVPVSADAGRYVCNGWLYRCVQQLTIPVGFLHIPPAGLPPARLLSALASC